MIDTTRVLLVDCEEKFRTEMAVQLAGEGLHVETAADGLEAITTAHAVKGGFHVAVIDEVMEPASGTDIMVRIRQYYPGIEAVILTRPGAVEQGEWAMQRGAFCHVDKPVDAKVLALSIRCAARFGYERQRSLALETLVAVAQRVGVGQKSEEELYQQLYEEASKLLPGLDGFLITHYDEQGKEVSFPFCYSHGKRSHIPSRRQGNSIAEYILRTKKPLLLPYGDKVFREEHGLNPPDMNLGYSASEIVAPMFLEGQIYGTIFATTFEPGVHYTPEHLQVLQTFANQVAITIRNVKQLEEAGELRDATAALAGHRGKDAVLQAIVEGAHKLINSDFTGLILQEEDGTLRKVRPVIPESFFDRFEEPRQQGGLTRAVVDTRKPWPIWDTQAEPLVKESVRKADIRSMLALPLTHGDRVLGVLYTHTLSARNFVNHDVVLWASFATQAAAALDRVLEEERQIQDYKRLVRELGALNEQLDLNETMRRVATAAKTVFDSDTCRIFYVDPPTGRVLDSAWAEGDQAKYHVDRRPRPEGLTNHVLQTKAPFFFAGEAADGLSPRPELFSMGLQAVASLPLIYGGRMIGVLHCNYFTRKPAFNEHYKTLMEAFGARAAVALHKARRDRISEIWRGLDRDILTCSELRELYGLFARKAHDALDADFSIFYPYNPTVTDAKPMPLEQEHVLVEDLQMPWRAPRGGLGGGVHEEISKKTDALIVNDLDSGEGKYSSNLARREGVKAFVAVRLEVILPGMAEPRPAGILFLNYRKPAAFEQADLVDLRYASELIAAGILRLHLQTALQKAFEQRNLQLRAVIDIFQDYESESKGLNLDHIAERAGKSLGIDTCTIMEFDSKSDKFTGRGNYGLKHPEFSNGTPRLQFKNEYMRKNGPTIIPDVTKDRLMKISEFVKWENIASTIVYPLRAEGESLGLFFANYRRKTNPSTEDLESIGLFADVAAHVLHGANLSTELSETQLKLDRRRLLVWVSMLEDIWRHSLVLKASSIRNYVAILQKRLSYNSQLPPGLETVPMTVAEIDRLAADIANAPPRVPHYWEMQAELVPIAPLLQEIAERENKSSILQAAASNKIEVEVGALGGIQVRGYRRWLIYMFEAVLQNAYKAMPNGGRITITGTKRKQWAEIRIQDTGSGVPVSLRDKLFKVAITGKRDHAGLGIGSLLATTLVEENQGRIELEKPGPGDTTVLIRLPIARQAARQ